MTTMRAVPLRLALAVAIAASCGLQSARADIYTWVDANGQLNVSNVAPPDDARVLKVMHTAKPAAASDKPAPAPDAQALTDRVAQLEDQLQSARQQPPIAYAPPPTPPVVQYFITQAAPQPVVQYVVDQTPPAPQYPDASCDPSWYGCNYWASGFYPYTVVVGPSNTRPFRPGFGPRPGPGPRPSRPQPLFQTSLIQPLNTPIVQPLLGGPVQNVTTGFRRG